MGENPVDLCVGCLSTDRRLEPLIGEALLYFTEIVEKAVGYSRWGKRVCWECLAWLRSTLRYQRRVSVATKTLQQLERKLQQTEKYSITEQQDGKFEIHVDHLTDLLHLSRLSCETSNAILYITHEEENLSQEETHFIKVESRDEDAQFVEGYFVNDIGEDVEDLDHKELKAELKSDIFEYENLNHGSGKRKRGKQKIVEEFDASDDEPLTLKKLKQENRKARGKRKKTDVPDTKTKEILTNGCKKRVRGEMAPGVVSDKRVLSRLQSLNVPPDALEMVVLSWEEVEAERQRALLSEQYTRHTHRCESCAVGFNHSAKLKQHMRKHDPSSGELECGACHVRCREPHLLAAHRRRHRVRWRCRSCGALWSRAAIAADHLAREHGGSQPVHVCPVCGHTAPTLGKLRVHMRDHKARVRCELCGKSFRDTNSLRTHLFIHRGEKEHVCPHPTCDKRFLFKKAMEVHAATHGQSANLYCHQCDVTFKNRMSYYHHMKYNLKHIHPDGLKYACTLCEKRFRCPSRLTEHRAAVHFKSTPVRCTEPDCSFACASRPVLRAHIRSVHRGLRATRNHVCHTCGKAYTTKKGLEGHLRSHSGERPFRCAVCGATFGYQAALYNHNKLVHNKQKVSRNRIPAGNIVVPAAPSIAPVGTSTVTNITETDHEMAPLVASWSVALGTAHKQDVT